VGGAGIEPAPVVANQDRSHGAFADGEVDRAGGAWHERDDGGLVALADDAQRAMSALDSEVLDVRAAGFADS
jgi:hypothetical protein